MLLPQTTRPRAGGRKGAAGEVVEVFGVDGNRRAGEKQPKGERSAAAAVQPDSGVSLFPHYSAGRRDVAQKWKWKTTTVYNARKQKRAQSSGVVQSRINSGGGGLLAENGRTPRRKRRFLPDNRFLSDFRRTLSANPKTVKHTRRIDWNLRYARGFYFVFSVPDQHISVAFFSQLINRRTVRNKPKKKPSGAFPVSSVSPDDFASAPHLVKKACRVKIQKKNSTWNKSRTLCF